MSSPFRAFDSRTLLEIVGSACEKLNIPVPTFIVGSTEASDQELLNVAQEAARRLLEAHDWGDLVSSGEVSGDGATTVFALPSDIDRLTKDQRMWSSTTGDNLLHIAMVNNLRQLKARAPTLPATAWAMRGGSVEFYPAPASGENIGFDYITKNVVQRNSVAVASFATDDDLFALDCRLLELGIVWEWRKKKGLPYAEDMATYEIALEQEIGADNGVRSPVATPRSAGT